MTVLDLHIKLKLAEPHAEAMAELLLNDIINYLDVEWLDPIADEIMEYTVNEASAQPRD